MGFQIHLVEQWLCDRSRRFKCVTVYTNNQNHLLKVTLIKFNQHHLTENSDIRSAIEEFRSARLFSVGEGQIYIYSLATLPVHLNLVRIDDGDYERHIRNAQLSINLKRLSVCGKTLSMAIPGSDVQNNFYRQYKVTSKFGISICFDLISVVQMSLAVFGFLDISVCDGFVCNSTLAALQNFHDRWAQLDFQDIDSGNAIASPELFALIISKLISYKTKLMALGASFSKDIFSEIGKLTNALKAFQNAKGLTPTGTLTDETISELEKAVENLAKDMPSVIRKYLKGKENLVDFETSDLSKVRQNASSDLLDYIFAGLISEDLVAAKLRKDSFKKQKISMFKKMRSHFNWRKFLRDNEIAESSSEDDVNMAPEPFVRHVPPNQIRQRSLSLSSPSHISETELRKTISFFEVEFEKPFDPNFLLMNVLVSEKIERIKKIISKLNGIHKAFISQRSTTKIREEIEIISDVVTRMKTFNLHSVNQKLSYEIKHLKIKVKELEENMNSLLRKISSLSDNQEGWQENVWLKISNFLIWLDDWEYFLFFGAPLRLYQRFISLFTEKTDSSTY